ncbi:hypothetical protein RUM44_006141 [Polyplax serrata]|uniref:Uncharacterized protein n=1 Tax=Polyplax serrata TaxID=468196 RepID=A0ABR1AZ30_POLSC
MCNYEEGKNDFLYALQFVFGGNVTENPVNLVHKILREEFLVKKGVPRIEHAISGIITPKRLYDEELSSLNLNVRKKNLILYRSDFGNCIWGSSEDMERTINKFLRKEYLVDELRKAKKDMKFWTDMRKRASAQNCNSIRKSYSIVEEWATNFEHILAERESIMEQSIKSILNTSEEESSTTIEEETVEEHIPQETQYEVVNNEKLVNLESQIESLYGRIVDHLQPSDYIELLKQIIGKEIFYAHLCDSEKTALSSINFIKMMHHEQREMFISLEHYSHKLKNILLASDESGVEISSLEQLLIFLCKLTHYELIDEVPVVPDVSNTIIYVPDNLHFMSDGIISRKCNLTTVCMDSEVELEESYIQMKNEEQIKYDQFKDLLFLRYEILYAMGNIENDIFNLRSHINSSTQETQPSQSEAAKPSPPMEIYGEYSDIFTNNEEEWKKFDEGCSKYQLCGDVTETRADSELNKETAKQIIEDIKTILEEKDKLQQLLERCNEELKKITMPPVDVLKLKKNCIEFHKLDKSRFFYDKELRRLKKLVAKDDLEDFIGCKDWRKTLIDILMKNFNKIKQEWNTSSKHLTSISCERKMQLQPFIEHCSCYLTSTVRQIVGHALPFVELKLTEDEDLTLVSSFEDNQTFIVGIKHFNTFLKFIAVLAMFLELSVFDQVPLLIFEGIEEFFPLITDRLDEFLGQAADENFTYDIENPQHQLLMSVGQYFSHFINKNTPGKSIRKNGSTEGNVNNKFTIMKLD